MRESPQTPSPNTKNPLRAAVFSAAIAGLGMAGIAYLRAAPGSIAYAVIAGLLGALIVFAATYERRSGQTGISRAPLARASLIDIALIAIACVLAVIGVIYATWEFIVPALIFGGLGSALIALRHFFRQEK